MPALGPTLSIQTCPAPPSSAVPRTRPTRGESSVAAAACSASHGPSRSSQPPAQAELCAFFLAPSSLNVMPDKGGWPGQPHLVRPDGLGRATVSSADAFPGMAACQVPGRRMPPTGCRFSVRSLDRGHRRHPDLLAGSRRSPRRHGQN